MIRNIALLLLCILITKHISCQNFNGGLIIGVSSSQVSGDDLGGFHKAGLLIGSFVNRNITTITKLQMEIIYIQKGSKNPNINNIENENYNKPYISLSYIEVPILLNFLQSNNIQIETGIITGKIITGYYNDSYGKINNTNSLFSNYDLGALLGINYIITNKISLNSRISNSILPIGAEDNNLSNVYNSSRKGKYNSVISFTLNYKI